ncbi:MULTISPECIES: CO2 hydration protein [Nostocales]|uniref:CO2 hydration protein n=3 Tax=Nostocales TaxID=1161 RepID=A0A0C1QSW1_9CYAN|nr:CO2 hydration protein [Tolypothrix bouteillei]KAF3884015.1 CO2 hydration protein [Tolypothrix bouteillei VB521301]
MVTLKKLNQSSHPLKEYIHRLEAGESLLSDSLQNLQEVVGILHSYAFVLDAYSKNLLHIANNAFLEPFPLLKHMNGEATPNNLLRYAWDDRLNFEYAEYCAKTMFWHGGGSLDTYLNSLEFEQAAQEAILAKFESNLLFKSFHYLFRNFFPEQIRQLAYYSALGQFWRVMSDLFSELSQLYNRQEISSISQVTDYIQSGLTVAVKSPITYSVSIRGKLYKIIPKTAGLKFLQDVAVPYVETIFFRGTPFFGTTSYNAQARQIPQDLSEFAYGVLYADPLITGGAGIPPTLLMQDLRHFLPEYLHEVYMRSPRKEDNLRVQICRSFQKSMFCVATAAIKGLSPYPLDTKEPYQQQSNRKYLESWMDRFVASRLLNVQ